MEEIDIENLISESETGIGKGKEDAAGQGWSLEVMLKKVDAEKKGHGEHDGVKIKMDIEEKGRLPKYPPNNGLLKALLSEGSLAAEEEEQVERQQKARERTQGLLRAAADARSTVRDQTIHFHSISFPVFCFHMIYAPSHIAY
jgi:hypothetical protein